MLDFFIIFLLFLMASCGVSWVMYSAIQHGEIFGKWQKVLDKLYPDHPLMEKFLGGCFKCFSHLWALLVFGCYILFYELFMETGFGWWYLLIYVLFVPVSITLSNLLYNIIRKLSEDNDLKKRIEQLEEKVNGL